MKVYYISHCKHNIVQSNVIAEKFEGPTLSPQKLKRKSMIFHTILYNCFIKYHGFRIFLNPKLL